MTQTFTLIFIITAAQSFFLSLYFILKRSGIVVLNRLIAIVTFSFCVMLTNTYINFSDINIGSTIIQDIANNIMWFIGPALYLYVIYDDSFIKAKVKLHLAPYLIPFFLDVLFSWPVYDSIIIFIAFPQMLIYLFMTLWFCYKNYKHQKKFFTWALPAVFSFFLLVILNFTLIIFDIFGKQFVSNYIQQSFVIFFAFPIFYIAYKEMNSKNDFGFQKKKYKTTHLPDEKIKDYLKRIEAAMNKEHFFLQKSLTLHIFSQEVAIKPKYISQVINQQKGVSFSEYILQFRLEKVKKALVDPKNKHLTIYGIAQDCGFNSNSRFSHLFKKHTGLTAKQFQQKHSKF